MKWVDVWVYLGVIGRICVFTVRLKWGKSVVLDKMGDPQLFELVGDFGN